jgi:hypothetical protein
VAYRGCGGREQADDQQSKERDAKDAQFDRCATKVAVGPTPELTGHALKYLEGDAHP